VHEEIIMDIKKIIASLTLDEKCALLSGVSAWDTPKINRLGIPSTKCADGPYGLRKEKPVTDKDILAPSEPATCFPLSVTLASSWDTDLASKVGQAIAEEAIDQGVQTVLGPGVNIKRSPLCGRNFEYFSEDPFLAGRIGASFVQGVQSQGIGTSLKHFAVNSQEFRRMMISSEVDERALREIYLSAFEHIVKTSQPYTIMCSYNRINGVFASDNKYLLTDILRKEWGYRGIVVSDWGAVNDRVLGVLSGLDIEMPNSEGVFDRIVKQAVLDNKIMESDIDICLERILQYVEKVTNHTISRTKNVCDYEAHHELARLAASSGIVLFKNNFNLLPINGKKSIAVVGSLAKHMRFEGSGSSQVNPRHLVSFTDTLDHEGIAYEYAPGYGNKKTNNDELRRAIEIARGKDIVLAFIGLTEEYESEGFDRNSLELPHSHNVLIRELVKTNSNFVVVLSIGSPVTMPWIDSVQSVVNLYLGGEAMGEAAYDVLFGNVSPSGKLAETFPYSLNDNPSNKYFGGGPKRVEYRESIFVGYRYYDTANINVLFPFGHGLSYAKFEYSNLKFNTKEVRNGMLNLSFEVRNVGACPAAEVAQVYVEDVESTIFREEKALKGFKKVYLQPNETQTIYMELDQRAWAFYNVLTHDWSVESGDFDIHVGSSSRDIRLSGTVYVASVEKVFPNYKKTAHQYYRLPKVDDFKIEQFITLLGQPLSDNHRYTRATFDENATLLDARKISLNGIILYRIFIIVARKMVLKDAPETTKIIAQKSAVSGPIRQLISYTHGDIDVEGAQAIVLIIKGRLFKGLKLLRLSMKKRKAAPKKKSLYW
jgi:beta-glucosidase